MQAIDFYEIFSRIRVALSSSLTGGFPMGLSKHYSCDNPGCPGHHNNTAPNWFVVSLPEKNDRDVPKIEKEHYFCTLECLLQWSKIAVQEAEGLKKHLKVMGLFKSRGILRTDREGMDNLYL